MHTTINVKILGAGCPKCKTLEMRIRALAEEHKLPIQIEKATNLDEIIAHGVLMAPGLVIGGHLKSAGIIPPNNQLVEWLTGAQQ